MRLHQLLHDAKFSDPRGSHLSPVGEYNLRLGVMKELRPELIATYQGEWREQGMTTVLSCKAVYKLQMEQRKTKTCHV